MPVSRGEVYYVDLDPVVGREIAGGKRRPVVVLSINDLNRKPLVVAVVPGTSTTKRHQFRNVVTVAPSATNGLSCDTNFQCHQIRALDHSRFRSPPAGRLAPADLAKVEGATKFCLGLL